MIYLDNNATTQPDKGMLDAAVNAVGQIYGNPSSLHVQGQSARDILERAREQVATSLKARPSEIVFTSGGTEANNLALSGFCNEYHKVISSIEHSSVFNLGSQEVIDTMPDGTLDFDTLDFSKLKYKTVISVMLANNETGVILDPRFRLLELKKKYGFMLHVDAVQAFGKMPIDLSNGLIDLLTISAHKIHGLKGCGALFVSRYAQAKLLGENSKFKPLMIGGTHERGYRPGTENMIGAFSLGYMAEKFTKDVDFVQRVKNIGAKRDKFEELLSNVSRVNGSKIHRIGTTTNLFFPSIPGGDLDLFLENLSEKGLCASGKSACMSGMPAPSRVLCKMYGDENAPEVNMSIRFSLSVNTTDEEIIQATDIIKNCL